MIEEDGYLVIRKAIPFDIVDFVAEEIQMLYKYDGENGEEDLQVPEAYSRYGLLNTDILLLRLWGIIEAEVGLELCPTYSYARYYDLGQQMTTHVDRPACEYSITLNLWNEKEPWPIWFSHPKGYPAQVDLHPGDLIIYKGCETPHWRDVNTSGKVIQTFLHYVDVNGPNAEWAYDKRNLKEVWKRKY